MVMVATATDADADAAAAAGCMYAACCMPPARRPAADLDWGNFLGCRRHVEYSPAKIKAT